ncbi:hypothetical protein ACJ73_08110 [Blastomyces percursus]|uniref:Methyltransferase type 11 domain-containing protein n=1 Tax=Blastomyces percursus TaxID=1658174 RepID=A0A1J9QXJ6_9EURO|nr:hypothetical protein ACJ73_08110 [Blastomyces percursus]
MPPAHQTPSDVPSGPGALAAANEEFWNNSAPTVFKETWVIEFQVKLRTFLEKNMDWLGIANDHTPLAERKMLDYACGDGFLTKLRKTAAKLTIPKVYRQFFTKCVGIDLAAGMVKQYNDAATELGLSQEKMYAVKGDLSSPVSAQEPPKPEDTVAADLSRDEFFNFDFAGVALALHHMENPEAVIVKMTERLKSGGVILAIDLLQSEAKDGEGKGGNHHHHQHNHHGGHSHGHGHAHGHTDVASAAHAHGPAGHTISHEHPTFSLELAKDMFTCAGLVDVDVILSDWKLELPFVTDPDQKLFFVKGRKP